MKKQCINGKNTQAQLIARRVLAQGEDAVSLVPSLRTTYDDASSVTSTSASVFRACLRVRISGCWCVIVSAGVSMCSCPLLHFW